MNGTCQIYDWVTDTRTGLLEYCATLPPEILTQRHPGFGLGSVRGAMIHIAECYEFWLAKTLFGRECADHRHDDYPDAASIRTLFARCVDPLVAELLTAYPGERVDERLALPVTWQPEPLRVTPLWLFTHVVTHEFHHKGQVVALGRLLGYPPPETDLAMPR